VDDGKGFLSVGMVDGSDGDGVETEGLTHRFKAMWRRRFGSSERLRVKCWMILVKLMG
jgi:hypothetical protein